MSESVARSGAEKPSVNRLAWPLVQRMAERAGELKLHASRDASGALLIDAGIAVEGSIAAGLAVAELCMGGLGRVEVRQAVEEGWPTWIDVRSSQPVLACLASQYAGWSLTASKEETGGKKFFSLGSGPARALAGKETLFDELGYRDDASCGCLVMEVGQPPPPVIVRKVLSDCRLEAGNLAIVLTPTTSLAGTTQVVARVLEVALHKAHVLGFPLDCIVEGTASAPLPPPAPDGLAAMGRTNDAILYGGRVHLMVRTDDDAAHRLALSLPSQNSRDYGASFAEIFTKYEYDFYKVDPALFAPAEVWVSNLTSGRSWHAGQIAMTLLREAWLTPPP